MNILPVTVEYGDKQRVQVRLPDGVHLIVEVDGSNAAAGEQAWLGVRPEHLVVESKPMHCCLPL
jgi:multiple sugar transport system ATP-binding protein